VGKKSKFQDYEPLTRSGSSKRSTEEHAANQFVDRPSHMREGMKDSSWSATPRIGADSKLETQPLPTPKPLLKRGHALSVAGLFLFTAVLYFRPYELFPSLSSFKNIAYWIAVFTLVAYVPTQLGLEGKLTIRPREINLALLLLAAAFLSIPLATDPSVAWTAFTDFLKVIVIFVILVNVVRTEKRLRALIFLSFLAACVSSVSAVNDYRIGNFALGLHERIQGFLGNMFDNPNDLALHLVTMVPIAVAFSLGARSLSKKLLYLALAILFAAGVVATTSRGGLVGLACVMTVLGWKLARRNRALFGGIGLSLILLIVLFGPGMLKTRLAAGNDASAVTRTNDLKRSIFLTVRHPLVGIGMNNYPLYSNSGHATHNAFTQVAVELGIPAMVIYIMFLVTPIRRVARSRTRSLVTQRRGRLDYLAIGLETSLISYMVTSFFLSVAFLWYAYYLVGYAVVLHRLTEPKEFLAEESTSQTTSGALLGSPGTQLIPANPVGKRASMD
jgi:putative inorganic carbon (hco3(-)) transporter